MSLETASSYCDFYLPLIADDGITHDPPAVLRDLALRGCAWPPLMVKRGGSAEAAAAVGASVVREGMSAFLAWRERWQPARRCTPTSTRPPPGAPGRLQPHALNAARARRLRCGIGPF